MRDPVGRSGAGKTTPCCSKVGIKRGPWTPEEDEILAGYIKKHGEGRWRTLPKLAGLLRCGKSCRLRWMNYLRPHLKRGLISPDEEDLILRLHRLLGNRWSLIAGRIPGRTDNEIKNYWNTHLSKKLISQGLDPRTHKPLEIYNFNPNPTTNNYYSSPVSDHAHNNNHISSPARDNPNPNPILATPNDDPLLPPPNPPVMLSPLQLQEASTNYASKGLDANSDEMMFSSFLDLDALIMNDDDMLQQHQRATTVDDDNQIFQGQFSSPMMSMMMQQPMSYGSSFPGFDHDSAVWGPEVGLSNQRDQGNRNLDPRSTDV